ncbi:MAG: SGNH/GDSL hydrolase family protein [Candidatus Glassbacteria bacterium]|nr:SGNH/GDSL hydrolase family protein [Candidatus Glassbacteria bacterium]
MLKKAVFILMLSVSAAFAGEDFFIRDGDVVCFWGNSITDYGIYPRMIENYVLTFHPEWKVDFCNLGWGGDEAKNIPRLERDIQLCKPTKVTIMLGMNDGGYCPFDPERLETYLTSMKKEIEIFQKHSGAEVMLVSPTPFDLRCRWERVTGQVGEYKDEEGNLRKKYDDMRVIRYPEALNRFSHELQKLALSLGLKFVDLNFEMEQVLDEIDGYDKDFRITAEGVHPNVDGQFQMGLCILDGMQGFRRTVETVIDAAAGKVVSEQEAATTGLKATSRKVSFTRRAARLPLPVYPSTRGLIQRVLHYPCAWDRDIIKVTGLDTGWYGISIDGGLIEVASAAQLGQGVNLSRYPNTPQMIQAYRVFEETEKRNAAFWTKWRRVLLDGVYSPRDFTPFVVNPPAEAVHGLEQAERAAFEAQHRLNKPAAHRYEISPVEHPAVARAPVPGAGEFLENMVSVRISVDSRTIPSFEPPLCIRGNFAYAPQYSWGLIASKSYYGEIPVRLYDDGTHGDKLARDGVYSVGMFFRKGAGEINFMVRDGVYLTNYWNSIYPEKFTHNPNLTALSAAWGELLGKLDEDRERIGGFPLDRDLDLVWDKTMLDKALEKKLIYQP